MHGRTMHEIVRRQNPATLPASATVKDACGVMRDRRIGAVLVTGGHGNLVGIFTGRDAVRALAESPSPTEMRLSDAMTPSPETIGPRDRADDALRLMFFGGYRHLPILDEAGKICGIVSYGDFSGLELAQQDAQTELWEVM